MKAFAWNVFGVAHLVFWCPPVVAAPNHLRHLSKAKTSTGHTIFSPNYTLQSRNAPKQVLDAPCFFSPSKHTALTLYKLPHTTHWCGTNPMSQIESTPGSREVGWCPLLLCSADERHSKPRRIFTVLPPARILSQLLL